jgi:hypothetical protein
LIMISGDSAQSSPPNFPAEADWIDFQKNWNGMKMRRAVRT